VRFAQSTWISSNGWSEVEKKRTAEAAPGRNRFLAGAASECDTGGHGFSRGFRFPATGHSFTPLASRHAEHTQTADDQLPANAESQVS